MVEHSVTPRPTLRERKKRATRQRISDIATAMFAERGFDHVTVAQIAEAADVSTMTVFNHFPRKEDIFLDRLPEMAELLRRAVRDRAADETVLEALHGLLLDLLEQRHPLAAVIDSGVYFWRTVLDANALRARAREAAEELEALLADLLAEETGETSDTPRVRLAAALIMAGCRTIYLTGARRILAGERADDIVEDQRAHIHHVFAALERALAEGD